MSGPCSCFARSADECACGAWDAPASHDEAKGDWIEWNGGNCPVPYETGVEVRFRDDEVYTYTAGDLTAAAMGDRSTPQNDNWMHNQSDDDIVAYRVVQP